MQAPLQKYTLFDFLIIELFRTIEKNSHLLATHQFISDQSISLSNLPKYHVKSSN